MRLNRIAAAVATVAIVSGCGVTHHNAVAVMHPAKLARTRLRPVNPPPPSTYRGSRRRSAVFFDQAMAPTSSRPAAKHDSTGLMRGDPSERNVPSNATRAAFRRAIPSRAISGAPSIQVKAHQGQNGSDPSRHQIRHSGGRELCLRLLLRTMSISKSAFIRLLGPRALLFLGDTLVFDRWIWLQSRLPPPPASLIDVGCGNGWLALNCSRLGYRTLGIGWDGPDLQKGTEASGGTR